MQANVEDLFCHIKSTVIYRTMWGQALFRILYTIHNATLSTSGVLLTEANLMGKGEIYWRRQKGSSLGRCLKILPQNLELMQQQMRTAIIIPGGFTIRFTCLYKDFHFYKEGKNQLFHKGSLLVWVSKCVLGSLASYQKYLRHFKFLK